MFSTDFIAFNLILILCGYECHNWCQYVYPNNTYIELEMYFRLSGNNSDGKHIIYTKKGFEWQFEINFRDKSLNMLENTVIENKNRQFARRFSLLIGTEPFDCILKEKETVDHYCHHWNEERMLAINTNVFTDYSVFVRPSPINNGSIEFKKYLLTFWKTGLTNIRYFHIEEHGYKGNIQIGSKNSGQTDPEFIKGLRLLQNLTKNLNSVVHYIDGEMTGYILLFNIENRPKFCFTEEYKPLAEECKSPDNMTALFDECFTKQNGSDITVPISPTHSSVQTNTTNIVISIIMCIILVIIVITIFAIIAYAYNRKMKKDKQKPKFGDLDSKLSLAVVVDSVSEDTVEEKKSKQSLDSPELHQSLKT